MPESPIDLLAAHTKIDPRPYQTRIVNKVFDMFNGSYCNGAGETEPAARSVMIESPTGSGKSCMGLLIAKALQVRTGAAVGWVAMRRNLLQQVSAENERHAINVDLHTISMFAKTPPRDIDLLVVDECVPGDTLVDVVVDGQRRQACMEEVVRRGVGEQILSYSEKGNLEYAPITTRTPMGRKELLEVTVAVEGVERILLITEEGRVWTEDGYKRPLELPGNTILCKSSGCQTYLYGEHTTQRASPVRSDSVEQGGTGSALCLRLRSESPVVPVHEDLQDVPLQSSSTEGGGSTDRPTGADHSWDHAGRRIGLVRPESPNGSEDQRPAENPALDEAAIGIRAVAARSPASPEWRVANSRESRVRSRGGRVQHALPPVHPGSRQPGLPTAEVHHSRVSGPPGRVGFRGLVDGRRLDTGLGYACLHGRREPTDCGLASGSLEHYGGHFDGQAGGEAVPAVSAAERGQRPAAGGSLRDRIPVVQVRSVHVAALVRGTVVGVRRTGRVVETYDIGVARNHNFFADGILIHNCQHDAASSMAHLHNVIQPKWILGLTATPFRTDRVQLCFDKVVKDAGIHQLIQDGYLSAFDHYTIPKWDVRQLAGFYSAEPERWGKSIFFFHTLGECFALHELLKHRGIVSDVVTGSSDRDRQLASFRRGDVQVLMTFPRC